MIFMSPGVVQCTVVYEEGGTGLEMYRNSTGE